MSGPFEAPGILAEDGSIDLVGPSSLGPATHRTAARPSGDAWLTDRSRRGLLPLEPSAASRIDDGDDVVRHPHRDLADRFARGDYAATLTAAELRLGLDPGDQSARRYAEVSRQRLEARYAARIGSLDFIFRPVVPEGEVRWLGLDPQTTSLLALFDGQTTVAEALEIFPLGRLEALRVFTELLDVNAIVRAV